jgi:hypothetical protein
MLDNIQEMFSDQKSMVNNLKKKSYEANMEKFRNSRGHFIDEMIRYVKTAEDEKKAADEVGKEFAGKVHEAYSDGGRINGRMQMDMNLFMIYYVFPSILLTDEECADSLCMGIKDAWNGQFKDTDISYTTYDKLYDSFNEKIFGMF